MDKGWQMIFFCAVRIAFKIVKKSSVRSKHNMEANKRLIWPPCFWIPLSSKNELFSSGGALLVYYYKQFNDAWLNSSKKQLIEQVEEASHIISILFSPPILFLFFSFAQGHQKIISRWARLPYVQTQAIKWAAFFVVLWLTCAVG